MSTHENRRESRRLVRAELGQCNQNALPAACLILMAAAALSAALRIRAFGCTLPVVLIFGAYETFMVVQLIMLLCLKRRRIILPGGIRTVLMILMLVCGYGLMLDTVLLGVSACTAVACILFAVIPLLFDLAPVNNLLPACAAYLGIAVAALLLGAATPGYTELALMGLALAAGQYFSAVKTRRLVDLLLCKQQLRAVNYDLYHGTARDPLTGLITREQSSAELNHMLGECVLGELYLHAMAVDIDHFRAYNRMYGRDAGDRLLSSVGDKIRAFSEANELSAARVGAGTFLICCADIDAERGATLARQMLACIAALGIPHAASETAETVTVSIGMTSFVPWPGLRADEVWRMLQRALYQAKERGRNRVCFVNAQTGVCGDADASGADGA